MATIPATYAQLTIPLHHVLLTRPAALVFGVHVLSSPTDASDLADTCVNRFITNCDGLIDNQVTIGPAHVSWNDGSGVFSGDGISTGPGTLNDATLPPNCAVLLSKSSSAPGRGGRGRTYVPWAATESSVNEAGGLDPAAAVVIGNAFNDFRTDMNSDNNDLVILHAGAGIPAFITNFTCQLQIATQRRRLR